MTNSILERLALRPHEAAKALGISPRTLWAQTSPRGPIPCIRVGSGKSGCVLYSTDELKLWLNQQAHNRTGGVQ